MRDSFSLRPRAPSHPHSQPRDVKTAASPGTLGLPRCQDVVANDQNWTLETIKRAPRILGFHDNRLLRQRRRRSAAMATTIVYKRDH